MADVIQDGTPLRVGVTGHYQGLPGLAGLVGSFVIIGRVQYRYEEGVWNEWCLSFNTGTLGWLSESSGDYVISAQCNFKNAPPEAHRLKAGTNFRLQNIDFRVESMTQAHCVALQGELPQAPEVGEQVWVVDCRGQRDEKAWFMSLEYRQAAHQASAVPVEATPSTVTAFLGEALSLDRLRLVGLELRKQTQEKTTSFNCPTCGATIQLFTAGEQLAMSIACGSCGSVIAPHHHQFQVVAQYAHQTKVTPRIALGSVGKFFGHSYRVVGFMRRATTIESITYRWHEYLLHEAKQGYRWLTESDNHWNWVTNFRLVPERISLRGRPGVRTKVEGQTKKFAHFSDYRAKVDYVVGEFYWQVKVGEEVTLSDFIAPPYMLSYEHNQRDATISLATYVPSEQVQQAFQLKSGMPSTWNVFANQPRPESMALAPIFLRFFITALMIVSVYVGFDIFRPGTDAELFWWAVVLLFLLGPAIVFFRIMSFESKRWQESQYGLPPGRSHHDDD